MIKPFSESALFEIGSDDPFFTTGSVASIGEDQSFTTPLRDKEQFKVTFAVRNPVKMPGNSSSIYYFNVKNGQWNIPLKAVKDIQGPFTKVNFRTQGGSFGVTDGSPVYSIGSYLTEDAIGFDCHSNSLASGSLNVHRDANESVRPNFTLFDYAQSSFDIFEGYSVKDGVNTIGAFATVMPVKGIISVTTQDFPKSIQRNSSYDASHDEVFELPIDRPFLLEKVIVNSPFSFGKGWFADTSVICDLTTSAANYVYDSTPIGGFNEGSIGIDHYLYDEGGPGITLSLFCQKPYGQGKIRDLICRNLITHVEDMSGSYETTKGDGVPGVILRGGELKKLSKGSSYTVVTGSSSGGGYFFTGSVVSKMTPDISNGVKIRTFTVQSKGFGPFPYVPGLYREHLSKRYISPDFYFDASYTKLSQINSIMGIDCMGRGMTGFEPSGGSVFGKEYVTLKESTNGVGDYINQFYVEDDAEREALLNKITALDSPFMFFGPILMSVDSLGDRLTSPYLLSPGDKLVLAVSKTRPAYRSYGVKFMGALGDVNINKGIGNVFTASFYNSFDSIEGHDVQLSTGSINITFYGSYVKENKEYLP